MNRIWLLAVPSLLAAWVVKDTVTPSHASLDRFDGHEVGRLETEKWRSYYGHRRIRLFAELVNLWRHQYHLPFWRASATA